MEISIRAAGLDDFEAIWEIIQPVIGAGETYVFAPDTSKDTMLKYWCGIDTNCYVACIEKEIVGTFILKDNQPDLGAHVANASYMTKTGQSGKGVGKTMGKFSLKEAARLGYKAMQFNTVVSSNERAVELWKKLGFKIIGEVPEAFQHSKLGLISAYIMWRKLEN